MARSYKKNAVCKQKNDKGYKKISNKKIRALHRRGEYLPDGKAYRKVVNPWDICDWKFGLGYCGTWEGYRQEKLEDDYSCWKLWRRRVLGEEWEWDDHKEYMNWYRSYKMK